MRWVKGRCWSVPRAGRGRTVLGITEETHGPRAQEEEEQASHHVEEGVWF